MDSGLLQNLVAGAGSSSQFIGGLAVALLYAVIGFLSAIGSILIFRRIFQGRWEQIFWASFLVVIAAFYLSFAAYFGASTHAWQTELVGVAIFLVCAVGGLFTRTAIAVGYVVHGLWDLAHCLSGISLAGLSITEIPLGYGIRRREFITLLGGAAAWPLAARAQQAERVRRIGVLMNTSADDPEGQARIAAFHQGLQEWGWTLGRNARIDVRWGAVDADNSRRYAAELVALAPDVILASASAAMGALQQTTRTVPIVFVSIIDPVGAGFVESLARPGGNATGFALFEYSLSGKWLELLKEIAPGVKRAAVLRDPAVGSGTGQYAIIQAVAQSLGVELRPMDVRDPGEIERAIVAFAQVPNGGLIIVGAPSAGVHRNLIITLAARHQLPAVYPIPYFARSGGLIAYGPDIVSSYRRAAGYVDRILKGEKPADLPVQAPTKYELVINLKTAKALGLEIPPMLLARADEVIE